MTSRLKISSEHKNVLHARFLSTRSKIDELKYKKYKSVFEKQHDVQKWSITKVFLIVGVIVLNKFGDTLTPFASTKKVNPKILYPN